MQNKSQILNTLKWKSLFVDFFPGDKELKNFPRQVQNCFYSFVPLKTFEKSSLICFSKEVLELLKLTEVNETEIQDLISGSLNPLKNKTYSMVYSGHQFGVWAGQLGDGRIINYGEVEVDQNFYTIQLKGIGLTPYSRFADGNLVLRAALREHLISEANFYLKIPTSRSLGVIMSGNKVERDYEYTHQIQEENGAVVCRIAPNFIRFGNFEFFASQRNYELMEKLFDYLFIFFYKEFQNYEKKIAYLMFFEKIVQDSALLVAKWQSFGFVHGVLNTDNMSIMGLTIDYGPFGFIEKFDPEWTPNVFGDQEGRYCYKNQPDVVQWNLVQLANCLFPLVQNQEKLRQIVFSFKSIYEKEVQKLFALKLGLENIQELNFNNFLELLMKLLNHCELDFTLFFAELTDQIQGQKQIFKFTEQFFDKVSYNKEKIKEEQNLIEFFEKEYQNLINKTKTDFQKMYQIMSLANPRYILRNWQLQECVEEIEQKNFEKLLEFEEMIKNPFKKNDKFEKYFSKSPQKYQNLPKFCNLSCSSQQLLIYHP